MAPGRPFMADKWFWEICSKEHPCAEAEGDCDEDYECEGQIFWNSDRNLHNYFNPNQTELFGPLRNWGGEESRRKGFWGNILG